MIFKSKNENILENFKLNKEKTREKYMRNKYKYYMLFYICDIINLK